MTAPNQTPYQVKTPDEAASTVALVSLGCPKNLVDSEKMLGLLAEAGWIPVTEDADPDVLIINTCGFLEASKKESLDELARASQKKVQGKLRRLVVAGCLVQRHRAKLLQWCPDIDAMIGVFDRDRIMEAVAGPTFSGKDVAVELPVYSSVAANATVAKAHRQLQAVGYYEDDTSRLRLTPRHYTYLRISEGCNQNCSFCTIPSIRGKMRSKPLKRILSEARQLMEDGAFELNLIGQDTTSYGEDIGYEAGLVGLLENLDRVAQEHGGAWIRLMYAYPSCFTDAMIDAIATLDNVVKYIDMPLQHINDRVLDRMRRRTSRRLIESLLNKLRNRVPKIAIRTTLISGFPGETEQEHDELLRFVQDFRFDHLGVFAYSAESGTPAGSLHAQGDAIPPPLVQERLDQLMVAQQQIVFERNCQAAELGMRADVLIDEALGPIGQGRMSNQAPQIDGLTTVRAHKPLLTGDLLPCRIVKANGYDLTGEPVTNSNLPILNSPGTT